MFSCAATHFLLIILILLTLIGVMEFVDKFWGPSEFAEFAFSGTPSVSNKRILSLELCFFVSVSLNAREIGSTVVASFLFSLV